jgi:hypothetical protein
LIPPSTGTLQEVIFILMEICPHDIREDIRSVGGRR